MKAQLEAELKAHSGPLYALAPGRRSGTVFSAGADNVVAEWNIDEGKTNAFAIRTDHTIYSLFNTGDGALVIGTINGSMHVIDLEERREIRHLKFHDKGVFHLHPIGSNQLAAACADGQLSIWNTTDWSLDRVLNIGREKVRRVDVHPATARMAVACSDGTIHLYDTKASFAVIDELKAHDGPVNSLAFLPDGSIVSGGKDAHLIRWVQEGRYLPVEKVPAHHFAIYDVAHNGAGILATASRDKTVKLWSEDALNAPLRLDRKSFKGHTHSVNRAIWLDASRLATCGDDARVLIWKVSP